MAVSLLMGAAIFFVLQSVTDTVAMNYARLYSANTVGMLNTYLGGEIALIKKAARSPAITDWFADEDDLNKKLAAYQEMSSLVDVLSGANLYLGIEKTRHEFSVDEGTALATLKPYATLAPDYYDDAWYFECASSDSEYLLNVDVDKVLHRKRVWLNYKVTAGGAVQGVLSTGLEFSSLVEELFSEYDNRSLRGLVVDERGMIQMDSALRNDENFLYYSLGDEYHIEEEFSDAALLSALRAYTGGIDGYFDFNSRSVAVKLSDGGWRYATIAPIAATTWSVVTFYDAASLFQITAFLPIAAIMFAMFAVFIAATGFASTKLIFAPFEKLMQSVARIQTNVNERIYGTDRADEIGELANTVSNMRDNLLDALNKVHHDTLTGIYNRRFLEENLNRVVSSMSRSGGFLSVMMIDVDYFKKYNDAYGHGEGDVCLKAIASSLAGCIVRADDFVARYGGEEFVVVLPHTDESGALTIADRLLECVRSCHTAHETDGGENRLTVSIGVTTGAVRHPQCGEDYIRRADEALYLSKQNGRNRYTFLPLTGDADAGTQRA